MASPSEGPLRRFIREIHRRSLWQVLGIYLLASWAVLGDVDTLGGALGLPDWFMPVALALLVVGLPIVLATAFVQEGGPGHDAGDVEVPAPATPSGGASDLFTWRNAILGGVGAFALLGLVGTVWVLFGGGLGTGEAPTSIEQSIAVLPFDDLSPEGDQQYFVEGLSEGIINALTQIQDLKVAARTSTFLLAEQGADIETVANALGVANVLEGSVMKSGDQVRITAQLIEAESSFNLWSATFNRELTDIFAIQDEMARAITDQLQVTLSGEQRAQLVTEATENAEAHEAYLRGRYFWNQRTEQGIRTATTEFQRAIELDPSYAEAYSGLADSYFVVDTYTQAANNRNWRRNREQGLIAARSAVSLAPGLGMAHASVGFGLFHAGDWDNAEREFMDAMELSPGYATAHQWYALFLWSTGRAVDGLAHSERALELDPVSPVISFNKATSLQLAGRIDEGIQQMYRTTELAPGFKNGWNLLASTLLEIGEYEAGRAAWVNFAQSSNADVQATLDVFQAAIRYRETGEPQTFPDLEGDPRTLSWVYAHTGQSDRALDLIEDLVRSGAYGWVGNFHVQFTSDLLGDDPRYQALLEEAGIAW